MNSLDVLYSLKCILNDEEPIKIRVILVGMCGLRTEVIISFIVMAVNVIVVNFNYLFAYFIIYSFRQVTIFLFIFINFILYVILISINYHH